MKTVFIIVAAYLGYTWYEKNHCSCGGQCGPCAAASGATDQAGTVSTGSDVAPAHGVYSAGGLSLVPKPPAIAPTPAPKPAPKPKPVAPRGKLLAPYYQKRLPVMFRAGGVALDAASKATLLRTVIAEA